jgi:regulatory protein
VAVGDANPVESEALRLVALRPRTEFELHEMLRVRGYAEAEIERAAAMLRRAGHLDDAKLAAHFIASRADRLGHGPVRLIADLERRGISRSLAEAAWREAVESGAIDPLEILRRHLRRKLGTNSPNLDRKRYARVYNALCRAGFDAADVRRELGREPRSSDEADDEFA